MAIGRISGPMLLRDLERQGMDLSFDGDLIYLDVVERKVGINTRQPNVALDVRGSANVSSNLFVGKTVTVGNLYQLPTTQPEPGQIMVAIGGETSKTIWFGGLPLPTTRRRSYTTNIANLAGYANTTIRAPIGVSSIVYNLKVSRPVKVEAYGTAAMNEPNPYTFIATPDHLVDDGTVILNDGSSFQSRQYNLWANLEDPPNQNVWIKITSLDSYLANDPVTLEFLYFPAITDQGAHMDIVTTLPSLAYFGKMVWLQTNNKVYIYGPSGWFPNVILVNFLLYSICL